MKKNTNRNYFIVIDQSKEMWTAVKFALKRAKLTKSDVTTISFIAVSYTHLTLPTKA